MALLIAFLYFGMVGAMISGQIVLREVFDIGIDYIDETSGTIASSIFWPITFIPIAFYLGTEWFLKNRED